MTNEQIIATLTARLIAAITNRREFGMTHAQAVASVRAESTAGSSVWSRVDAHFGCAS